jgi:L-alanine-DL-glutamate epimerase-like enolase superfamily enzyme
LLFEKGNPVKVTSLETIRLREYPNLIWVQVHTDEGLIGLGETFFGAQAVEAYVHESVAPYLLGQDPLRIDRHSRHLIGYVGFRGTGVETRGNSAIDIALWDLLGQASGQPIYQLLGGLTREKVRLYNTCAGYRYIRERPVQEIDNWVCPRPVRPRVPTKTWTPS